MKNIVLLSLALMLSSTLSYAQIDIEPSEIIVRKTGLAMTNNITYGNTVQEMITAFGQPTSTNTQYWEMDEKTVNVYHYGTDASFTFEDGKLRVIKLFSSLFYIGKVGHLLYIKIGENISTLEQKFGTAYAERADGKIYIFIGIAEFLFVEYDSNNIITKVTQNLG